MMKPILVGLGVLVVMGLALPSSAQPDAAAASDAPFACLFEGVTAERRALASAAASRRLTDVPTDGEQRGGPVLESILAAIPRCGRAAGWSEDQQGVASNYVFSQLSVEHLRRHYAQQGIDLSMLDSLANDRAQREERFEAAVARLRAQGMAGERPDSADDVASLYVMLVMHVRAAREGFASGGQGSHR